MPRKNTNRALFDWYRSRPASRLAVPWATSITLAGIAMVGALAGFIREAVTAREFGVGGNLDALVLAFAVMVALVGPLASGLNGTIVPKTVELSVQGGQSLAKHVWGSTTASAGLGILASTLMVGTALLFNSAIAGWGEATADTVRRVMLLLGVTAAFAFTLRAGIAAHLQALGVVRLPALSQALPAIAATVVILSQSPSPEAVALGFGCGALVDGAVMIGRLVVRVSPRHAGLDPRFAWPKTTIRGLWTLTVGSLVFAMNPVVDLIIAGYLGEGEASRVGLGSRIPLGLAALLAGSIGLPMFRKVALTRAVHGSARMYQVLTRATLEVGLVSATAAAGVMFFSPLLSRLLLGGGNEGDVATVAVIQAVYAAAIPVYVLGSLWAQAIITSGGHRTILLLGVAGFTVNSLLDLLLGRIWGGAGIAAATLGIYLANLSVMTVTVRRWATGPGGRGIP